jgi:predicted nucleotidyltransferase
MLSVGEVLAVTLISDSIQQILIMENKLKTIFGKEIDLVEKNAVENSKNDIRRKIILDGEKVVFSE